MAQSPTVTHYEVLDVPATADAAEIKKAYQRRVRSSHPDVGGSAGLFRLVQEAFDTLSDPSKRAAYDRSLKDDATGGSNSNPPPRQERREEPPKQGSQREKPQEARREPPRQQPKAEPSFQAMETPPAAPVWSGPATEFRPPLAVPPWDGKKVRLPVSNGIRLWRKVLLIIGGVMCIFPVISTILAAVMYGGSGGFNTMVLTGVLGIVLTAGFWGLIAMTPWWIARRKQTPPAPVLAGSILPEQYITTPVHGIPGRDLSVARFGENAKIGIEGEQRTARLIAESVLPGLPSARLINGLRWPGTEHADIDHAVIAGDRIALIDSKMWSDGNYWWDNKRLFRSGKELTALKLGAAVSAMRAAHPYCQVEGWVVVHSPSGKLARPGIERAGMLPPLGMAPVYLVNAAELPGSVHAFLAEGEAAHTVEVPVLASLLHSML
jgi:hypothetical protein